MIEWASYINNGGGSTIWDKGKHENQYLPASAHRIWPRLPPLEKWCSHFEPVQEQKEENRRDVGRAEAGFFPFLGSHWVSGLLAVIRLALSTSGHCCCTEGLWSPSSREIYTINSENRPLSKTTHTHTHSLTKSDTNSAQLKLQANPLFPRSLSFSVNTS